MNRTIAWMLSLCFMLLIGSATLRAEPIEANPRLPESLPWNLAELSEPPTFTWLDRDAPVRSLLYPGEPYKGQPTQVFAYYATPGTLSGKPEEDQNLPAVVLIHGGGGTAFREWAELWAQRGYAAIAMDLAGYRPIADKNPHQRENRTRLDHPGPDQGDVEKFGGIDNPAEDQWPYHAVANVIRGHSLLCSFPEIDAKRTAVTGISWGGYLTCIVAGVDSRFKAAVPVYGCGYLHENSVWLDRLAKMEPKQRQRWVELWDPSRYLPAVSMPILFVNGTNDFAYPLDSYMKSFDAVPGEKQIRVTVNMPHGHPPGWQPLEIGRFVDHHLSGKPGLPVLTEPKVDQAAVQVSWEGPVALSRASLHFTTDDTPINKRTWTSQPAKIEGSKIQVNDFPAKATAWFLTATDEQDATISTRVQLP